MGDRQCVLLRTPTLIPFVVVNNMAEVKNRRVTMTKPIVGRVKASAYALPDSDFVYGIESKLDSEGAGAGKSQRVQVHALNQIQ